MAPDNQLPVFRLSGIQFRVQHRLSVSFATVCPLSKMFLVELSACTPPLMFLVLDSRSYRYCRMLEEGCFRGRTADFVVMFLFGGVLMTVSFTGVPTRRPAVCRDPAEPLLQGGPGDAWAKSNTTVSETLISVS